MKNTIFAFPKTFTIFYLSIYYFKAKVRLILTLIMVILGNAEIADWVLCKWMCVCANNLNFKKKQQKIKTWIFKVNQKSNRYSKHNLFFPKIRGNPRIFDCFLNIFLFFENSGFFKLISKFLNRILTLTMDYWCRIVQAGAPVQYSAAPAQTSY